MLPQVQALRYVTPLREGGSLPGIVEADDLGTYVVKFRGAGQGPKVLVAEVIATELARALGLLVPRLVVVDVAAPIASYEADEEVQDLLTASIGLNLGVDFLPGAFGVDAQLTPDPALAASILWFDALVANVDRTWRNPNLLVWHRRLWCIDHGASLYFHHAWSDRPGSLLGDATRFARQTYDVSQHVLSAYADGVAEADVRLRALVTAELIVDLVASVPDIWMAAAGAGDAVAARTSYVEHLTARVAHAEAWLPRTEAA